MVPEQDEPASTPAPSNLAFLDLPMADPLVLQVVEAESGHPIPGAEVAWAVEADAWGDPLGKKLAAAATGAWEEILFAEGRKLVADDRGEAALPRLPSLPAHLLIAARSGGMAGRRLLRLPVNEELLQIALGHIREFLVQVVDGEGKARAGVPVRLLAEDKETPQGERLVWEGRTEGPEGTARARFVPGLRWAHEPRSTMGRAALHPLVGNGVTAPVDLARLPDRPVRLVLPPTGSVRARVAGRPGLEAQVELTTDPILQGSLAEPLAAGEALFPYVGLDLRLRASIRPWPWHPGWPRFAGPTHRGEEVLVEIPLGDPVPVLRVSGRAVDERGVPFRDRLLYCSLRFSNTRMGLLRSGLARTDGEGMFTSQTYELTGRWEDPADSRALEIVAWETVDRNGTPEHGPRAAIALPACPPDGRLDLGAVVLADELPLLAGSVQDARGAGVAGIRVALTPLEPQPGKPAAYFPTHATITDKAGRFRFWGALGGWLQVQVRPEREHDYLPCQGRIVAAGTMDLEFVLRGAGSIEGSLRLDPDVPSPALRVFVMMDTDPAFRPPGPPISGRGDSVDRDGRFMLRQVPPGPRTVRIQVEGRLLTEVPQILVREGEVSRDERLNGFDLRGRLRWLAVRLVDLQAPAAGSRLRAGEIMADGGIASLPAVEVDAAGWARILAPVEAAAILLDVHGYRPRRITWADDGRSLALTQAIPVTLQLSIPALPADGPLPRVEAILVRLRPEDPGLRDAAWVLESRSLSAHRIFDFRFLGDGRLHLPSPGTYLVEWFVETTGLDGRRWIPVPQAPPRRIQVEDRTTPQVFTGTYPHFALNSR